MATEFLVHIDLDDDGDFNDSGEDLSRDVLALKWRLGMPQAHEHVAEVGRAQITLRNEDQAYSPELSAIRPGQALRIQSDDGMTLRTHFSGHVLKVEPQPGEQGQRQAVIHAVDVLWQLQQRIRLPAQLGVCADEVIAQILDRMALRHHPLKGYWLLGLPDHGELGSNTRLPAPALNSTLESGISTFTYVGDTWGDGIPALEAIRQTAEAERGRFFVDRNGAAQFFSRHHVLSDPDSLASFANDFHALEYDYGAETISQVEIRLLPRSLGAAGSSVWTLAQAQFVPAGIENIRSVVARFRDEEDQSMGALNLQAPVPGLDYLANTQDDGSGLDLTDEVELVLLRRDFGAALLEIRNYSRRDVYLLAGAQLRGTPVNLGDPLLLSQTSHASLNFYGPVTLRLDLPLLDHIEQADSLARFELSRRKNPRGQIRSLTLDSHAHSAQMLARTLFERITITESQTGHEQDYFILGEAHEVDRGGFRHRVTWTLESAEANQFWLLGHSLLGQTTVLAY